MTHATEKTELDSVDLMNQIHGAEDAGPHKDDPTLLQLVK